MLWDTFRIFHFESLSHSMSVLNMASLNFVWMLSEEEEEEVFIASAKGRYGWGRHPYTQKYSENFPTNGLSGSKRVHRLHS